MWVVVTRIILRNRTLILGLLVALVAFMLYQAF